MSKDEFESRISRLEEILIEIESANDAVCAARPESVYNAMLDAGMEDVMFRLDKARMAARHILNNQSY